MIPLEPCCYTCAGPCQRVICRDLEPSPGEDQYICADCWDFADALRTAMKAEDAA